MQQELADQTRYQEMEILLSHDFDNMDLVQLEEIASEYISLQKQGETLHWNSEQYKAWQYLYLRIEQQKNKDDLIKVGDVFHSCWGYDQTNTEFYKIVSISKTGKSAKVVQVAAEAIGDEKENARNMSDSAIPDPENIIDSREQLVKVERRHQKNAWTNKSEQVGEIQLRGSVFIGTDENSCKHLTTLYRVKGACGRSWYA
jgi:hypothetical protein